MPQVAMCTKNVEIPAHGVRILFKAEWLEYPPVNFVQHLSVCLVLLIQPHLTNVAVLDWNRQESDHHDAGGCGHLADLRRLIAQCHIYRPLMLLAIKIREMCSIEHEDPRNQRIPHSEH